MASVKRLIVTVALLLAGCGGASGTARVERVVDGDTIVVRMDGRRERVRYIGVDTPESVKPDTRVECFGKSAAKFNRRLVEGREVRLRYDAEARDRYGRLLAYVYRDDLFVNAELIRLGYGKPLEIAPNVTHAAELRRLAAGARRARRGLWSRC
jgi:micrococcal nuclease